MALARFVVGFPNSEAASADGELQTLLAVAHRVFNSLAPGDVLDHCSGSVWPAVCIPKQRGIGLHPNYCAVFTQVALFSVVLFNRALVQCMARPITDVAASTVVCMGNVLRRQLH